MVTLFGPRRRTYPPVGTRRHHKPVPSGADVTAEARALARPGGVRIV